MNRRSKAHRVAYDNPNLKPLSHDLQGSMESGLFLLGVAGMATEVLQ